MDKKTELTAAERAEIDAAATVYLGAGKKWRPAEYRLEHRGASPDGKYWIVVAVHADDEAGLSPGGGKSLELWIDPKTKMVMKELGFQ
jgi:hypothetical protein